MSLVGHSGFFAFSGIKESISGKMPSSLYKNANPICSLRNHGPSLPFPGPKPEIIIFKSS